MMESSNKTTGRISSIVICLFALVCVALILTNFSRDLSDILKAEEQNIEIEVVADEKPPPVPPYDELMELLSRGD